MKLSIVIIGDEILLGQVTDTNSGAVARTFRRMGWQVASIETVGDNVLQISAAVERGLEQSDLVITTGGLGPTADDITKETCAEALGLPMERRPEAEAQVRAWFARNNRAMTENNLRQADFAKGAIILENHNGTAPACIVEKDGKAVINLPGPPRELIPLFVEHVAPYLARRSGAVIVSRYLRVFGMGESTVESKLHDLMENCQNPTVAPYCSTGEVQLRLTVRVAHEDEAAPLLDPLEKEIRTRLGGVIYAATDNPEYSMEQALVEALCAAKKTLVTAESCTGGMIASKIVNVPGASDALLEGCVTYSNAAKMRTLGVKAETLEKYDAVSRETALEMAEGARRRADADYAVSVTGLAGPGGGTPEKPVGTVWLGLSTREGADAKELRLTGNRERIRTLAALHAMHWALETVRNDAR